MAPDRLLNLVTVRVPRRPARCMKMQTQSLLCAGVVVAFGFVPSLVFADQELQEELRARREKTSARIEAARAACHSSPLWPEPRDVRLPGGEAEQPDEPLPLLQPPERIDHPPQPPSSLTAQQRSELKLRDLILEYVVEGDGALGPVCVIESPHPAVADYFVRGLRESRFKPALLDGIPVRWPVVSRIHHHAERWPVVEEREGEHGVKQ